MKAKVKIIEKEGDGNIEKKFIASTAWLIKSKDSNNKYIVIKGDKEFIFINIEDGYITYLGEDCVIRQPDYRFLKGYVFIEPVEFEFMGNC